jgi:hypothetical protein
MKWFLYSMIYSVLFLYQNIKFTKFKNDLLYVGQIVCPQKFRSRLHLRC